MGLHGNNTSIALIATMYFNLFQSTAEFVMKIDLFKFAGGEGNTQFGSDVIDSSKYPPLQPRLHELCTLSQFKTLLYDKSFDARKAEDGNKLSTIKQLERTLLENHESVFIPEDMEKKLATIPGKLFPYDKKFGIQ